MYSAQLDFFTNAQSFGKKQREKFQQSKNAPPSVHKTILKWQENDNGVTLAPHIQGQEHFDRYFFNQSPERGVARHLSKLQPYYTVPVPPQQQNIELTKKRSQKNNLDDIVQKLKPAEDSTMNSAPTKANQMTKTIAERNHEMATELKREWNMTLEERYDNDKPFSNMEYGNHSANLELFGVSKHGRRKMF